MQDLVICAEIPCMLMSDLFLTPYMLVLMAAARSYLHLPLLCCST